jgi:hypothetical protein
MGKAIRFIIILHNRLAGSDNALMRKYPMCFIHIILSKPRTVARNRMKNIHSISLSASFAENKVQHHSSLS